MRPEGNAPKNGEPTAGFSFMKMLQHADLCWSRICLVKNNVTTLEHPPYSPDVAATIFYVPLTENTNVGTVLL